MTNTKSQRVYVGTYTDTGSAGIYIYEIDSVTGVWRATGSAKTTNPTFLALHPNRRFLYAVNEVGRAAAQIVAYAVNDATGALTELNAQSADGSAPCHITVDLSGRCVVIANYGDGSILAYPILPDGRIGPHTTRIQHTGTSADPARQDGPHAHSVNLDPTGRYVVACDLGLDKLMIYRLDAGQAQLNANPTPFAALDPGAGPRHMAFHPNQKTAYVINEMGNTITVFDYHAKWGGFTTRQVISTLPAGYAETSYCADIHVHPNGKFVYGSNRGHDSIAMFAVGEDGLLSAIGHESVRGKWPRNFALDSAGQTLYVANQNSDNIVAFAIDGGTGQLSATGVAVNVPKPVCVCLV